MSSRNKISVHPLVECVDSSLRQGQGSRFMELYGRSYRLRANYALCALALVRHQLCCMCPVHVSCRANALNTHSTLPTTNPHPLTEHTHRNLPPPLLYIHEKQQYHATFDTTRVFPQCPGGSSVTDPHNISKERAGRKAGRQAQCQVHQLDSKKDKIRP